MNERVVFDLGGVVFASPFEHFDTYDDAAGLPDGQRAHGRSRDSSEHGRVGRARAGRAHDARSSAPRSTPRPRAAGIAIESAEIMATDRAGHSGARPEMVTAIARIREHGLRIGALTNNWSTAATATDRRSRGAAVAIDLHACSTSSSSRRVEGMRKPDPRIYELVCERLGVDAVRRRRSSTTSAPTSSRHARWA